MGKTGGEGIVLVDNPVGQYFVLRDLFPMNFIKRVMIVVIKLHPEGKMFGKACVEKLPKIPFIKYVVCDQESDGV